MDIHADCRLSEYMLDIVRITGPLSNSQWEQFQYLAQRQESRQNIAEIKRIGREVFSQNFYQTKTKPIWQSPRKYENDRYGDRVLQAAKILEDLLPKYIIRHHGNVMKDVETQTCVVSNDMYTQTEKFGGTTEVDVVDLTNLMRNTAKTVPDECLGNVEFFMKSCLEKLHTNYTEHMSQISTVGTDYTWNSHREYPPRAQEHISADFETHMSNVLNTTLSTLKKRMDSFVNYESVDKDEKTRLNKDRIQQYVANQRVQRSDLVNDIGNYELSDTNLETIPHEIENDGYNPEQYIEVVEDRNLLRNDTVSVPITTEYYATDKGKNMDSGTLSIPSTLSYYPSESAKPYNWARNCPSDFTDNSADDEYFRQKIIVPKLDLTFLKDAEAIDITDPDSDSSFWSKTPSTWSQNTFKEWLKTKGIDVGDDNIVDSKVPNEHVGGDESREDSATTEVVIDLNKECNFNVDEMKVPIKPQIAMKTMEEEQMMWGDSDETNISNNPKIVMKIVEKAEMVYSNLNGTNIPIEPQIGMKTIAEEEILWKGTMESMTTDFTSSQDEYHVAKAEKENEGTNPHTIENVYYGKKISALSFAAKLKADNFKSSSAPDVQVVATEKSVPKKSTSLNKVCKQKPPKSYQETQEARGHGDVQHNYNTDLDVQYDYNPERIEEVYPKLDNFDTGDLSPLEPNNYRESIWKAAQWLESVNTHMVMNEMYDIEDIEILSDVPGNDMESDFSTTSSSDIIPPKMIKCGSSNGQASTLQSVDSIANEMCYETEIPKQMSSENKLQRTEHAENLHLVGRLEGYKDSLSSSTENDMKDIVKTNLKTVTSNTNSSVGSADGYHNSTESMVVYHNLSQESDGMFSLVESEGKDLVSPVATEQVNSLSPVATEQVNSLSPVESQKENATMHVESEQVHSISNVQSQRAYTMSIVGNVGQNNEIDNIGRTEQFLTNKSEADESSMEYRSSNVSIELNYNTSSLESLSSSVNEDINGEGVSNKNEQVDDKNGESGTTGEQYRQDTKTIKDHENIEKTNSICLELESNQSEENGTEIIPNCLNHIAKHIQRGLNAGADDSVLEENCSMSIATIPPSSPSYFLNMENKIDSDRSDSFGSYHEPDILTLGSWESITPREEEVLLKRWPSVPPKYNIKNDKKITENANVLKAPKNKETTDTTTKAQSAKMKETIHDCTETDMSNVCKKEQNIQFKDPCDKIEMIPNTSSQEQQDNLYPNKEVKMGTTTIEVNTIETNKQLSYDKIENKSSSITRETMVTVDETDIQQHEIVQSETIETDLQMKMKSSDEGLTSKPAADISAASVIDEQRPLTTEPQPVGCSDNVCIGSVSYFGSQKSENNDIGETDFTPDHADVSEHSVIEEKVKDECDNEAENLNQMYYNRSADFAEAADDDSSVETENSGQKSLDKGNDLENDSHSDVKEMSDDTESIGSWDSNASGDNAMKRTGKKKTEIYEDVATDNANIVEVKDFQNDEKIVKPSRSSSTENVEVVIPNIDDDMSEKSDGSWDSSQSENGDVAQSDISADESSASSANSWDSCNAEDNESHEQDEANDFEEPIKGDTPTHEKQVIKEKHVSFDMNVIAIADIGTTHVDQVKYDTGHKQSTACKMMTEECSTEHVDSENDLSKSDESEGKAKRSEMNSNQQTPKRDTSSDDMSIESVGSWQNPEQFHIGIRGLKRRAKLDCTTVKDASNDQEKDNRETYYNQTQDVENSPKERKILYHGALVIKDRGCTDTSDDCSVIDMPESELAKWSKTATKQPNNYCDSVDSRNCPFSLPQHGHQLEPITTVFEKVNQPMRAPKGTLKPIVIPNNSIQQQLPDTKNARSVNSPAAFVSKQNAPQRRTLAPLAPVQTMGHQKDVNSPKKTKQNSKAKSDKIVKKKVIKKKVPEKVEVYGDSSTETFSMPSFELADDFKVNEMANRKQTSNLSDDFIENSSDSSDDRRGRNSREFRNHDIPMADDFVVESYESSEDSYSGDTNANCKTDMENNNDDSDTSETASTTNKIGARIHKSPVRAIDNSKPSVSRCMLTSKPPVSRCMPTSKTPVSRRVLGQQKKVTFAPLSEYKPPLQHVSSTYKWSSSTYSDQTINQLKPSSVLDDALSLSDSSQRLTSAYNPDAFLASYARKDNYGLDRTYSNTLMSEKRSLGELRIVNGPFCDKIEIINTSTMFSEPTRSTTKIDTTWEPLRMIDGPICPLFGHVKSL